MPHQVGGARLHGVHLTKSATLTQGGLTSRRRANIDELQVWEECLLRSAGSGKPYPSIKIALRKLAGPQAIRRVRPAALGQAGEVGPVVAFPEGLASAEARLARGPAALTLHPADQSAHRG